MDDVLGTDRLEVLICDAVRHLVDDGLWPAAPAQGDRDRASRAVITAREVEAAPDGRLMVPDGALITPEARDRARERGVRLVAPSAASHNAGLSGSQRALVGKLAGLLAAELSPPQIEQLAYWCLNEGSCADPNGVARIVDAGADRVGLSACAPPLDDAIVPLIDHTLLKPEATEEQVRQLCAEALEYGFASVCINPYYVSLVAGLLEGSRVRACTVVGFPLGAANPEIKAHETRLAVEQGAREIDMVINIGALKSGRDDWVENDIAQVVGAAHPDALVKVILESALLSDDEIVRACHLARDAGADFVKTSTGFGPGGATAEDVALMRATVGRGMGVKASGGISTRADAAAMIAAGATRIGASAGVRIAAGE